MTELIAALDVPTVDDAEKAAHDLASAGVKFFKVGLELYTGAGPLAVEAVARHGKVFLDLKLHDIPNTVAAAVKQAGRWGAFSVSVHLAGGAEMLHAAASVRHRPQLWGISLLTSLKDLSHLGSLLSAEAVVEKLAALGKGAGLEGAVCSGLEIGAVKAAGLSAVVPGIRPAGSEAGDQKRAVTTEKAAAAGADYIVVGRPILQAAEPAKAAANVLAALRKVHVAR